MLFLRIFLQSNLDNALGCEDGAVEARAEKEVLQEGRKCVVYSSI